MCYVWPMVTSSNSSFGSDDNAHAHAHSRCEDAPCCGCCPSAAELSSPEMDEMRDFEIGVCWRGNDEECFEDDEDGDDCTKDLGEDETDDGMTDGEADADALASAGWGTDEDYYLDSHWESQNEVEGDF